jgi:protein tyrosine phosphatase
MGHMRCICDWLKQGKRIYIHCAGGHGRTGVYVACLLVLAFQMDADTALYYTQTLHNTRRSQDKRFERPMPLRSPSHTCQIDFVNSFATFLGFLGCALRPPAA